MHKSNQYPYDSYTNNNIKEAAFKEATEIRRFEIELYWKRATYFWTIIGVIFAGYFALKASNNSDKLYFEFSIISLLGIIFSFAWFLVNRGSKFWQNNWERHVDHLENDVVYKLYKTIIINKSNLKPFRIDEYPYSVSKINQILSVIVTLLWLLLYLCDIHIFWGTTKNHFVLHIINYNCKTILICIPFGYIISICIPFGIMIMFHKLSRSSFYKKSLQNDVKNSNQIIYYYIRDREQP